MFWFLRKPSGKQTLTVGTTTAACDELDMSGYAGGIVTVSSGITLLTFYASHDTGGTFLPYHDKDNLPITLTVSSSYITQLPQEVYDLSFVKIVSNAAGTLNVSLKS